MFGPTELSTGVPAVTVNTPVDVATSFCVVTETLPAPVEALGDTAILTVSEVALFTVMAPAVMPAFEKVTVLDPCAK